MLARARWVLPQRRFPLIYRGITRRQLDTIFVRFFLAVSAHAHRFIFLDPMTNQFYRCRVEGGLDVRQPMVMDYEMTVDLREVT